jgi:peroxiredoxin
MLQPCKRLRISGKENEMRKVLLFLIFTLRLWAQSEHPILAVGSQAPNFELRGVDGAIHRLSDYSSSPVLVVVFTCNHCPIAQMYERRIGQLASDYKDRGVALVAIEPNDPKAIRIDELDSSDISDSLDEMKIRAAYKHLTYPYLYDGDTQAVTEAYGPQATPHAFVFDSERRLRYEGRIDNSYRSELLTTHEVRDAIDAVLAHRDVAVKHTGVFGCSTKWKEKQTGQLEALRKIESQPVQLEMVSADELRKLRTNPTGKMLLVSFWATWCGSCISEFSDFQDTFRMYGVRDLELVTAAANLPDEKNTVLRILEKMHATSRNLLFDSNDTSALQAAFDPTWESALPFTVLIARDGKVLYRKQGSVDILELRRTILANLPSDYEGFNKYWSER